VAALRGGDFGDEATVESPAYGRPVARDETVRDY
jgi:hypothetical protein